MTPHDDNSGDHGGGGQGENDRPGKEESDDAPGALPRDGRILRAKARRTHVRAAGKRANASAAPVPRS